MSTKSEELLKPEWLETYRIGLDLLWHQAVTLNSYLYLLDKIAHFPFRIFMPTDHLCWSLIAQALYESCLMGIWRIVSDSGPDLLTLRGFRDEVVKNACKSARDSIASRLRSVDFDNRVKRVERIMREIRNGWLAHLKKEAVESRYLQGRGMPIVPLNRLREVCDAVNQLINALSFDEGRGFIYLQYSETVVPPAGEERRSDIEKILDSLAQSSPMLSMPEDQPECWKRIRNEFSEEELAEYNKYRVKFGLPPV